MKFAVIADVHGNASALKAVLSELDNHSNIERIYCVGDMIGIGPDTNEVLEILFARQDVSMITGNHDEAILSLAKGEEHPRNHAHVKVHHQWIADQMDKKYIPKLEDLPRTINQMIEGKSVLFIHYHMHKEKWKAPISQSPFSRIVEPSLENICNLFKDRSEHLICFGHHHPTHFFQNNETIYLNPGSLGCHTKPIARYSIVSIDDGQFSVSLKEVSYENKVFLESFELLKVPAREVILSAFYGR